MKNFLLSSIGIFISACVSVQHSVNIKKYPAPENNNIETILKDRINFKNAIPLKNINFNDCIQKDGTIIANTYFPKTQLKTDTLLKGSTNIYKKGARILGI